MNIHTRQKHFLIRFKNYLHLSNQVAIKKLSRRNLNILRSKGKITVKRFNSSLSKVVFLQDRELQILTMVLNTLDWQPNGLINTFITQFLWRWNIWPEIIWLILSKDSKNIILEVHTFYLSKNNWRASQKKNPSTWNTFHMRQQHFNMDKIGVIILWFAH